MPPKKVPKLDGQGQSFSEVEHDNTKLILMQINEHPSCNVDFIAAAAISDCQHMLSNAATLLLQCTSH